MKGRFRFGHSIILRGFLAWILTLVLPLLLFFLFLYIQYGDNVIKVVSGNYDPLQQYGNSILEQVTRTINVWTSETADFDNVEALANQFDYETDGFKVEDSLIIIRREDEIKSLFKLSDEARIEIAEDFENVDISYLPRYGEFSKDTNERLVKETGYVIVRQIDFRYQDNEKGSIYIIVKYSNVPYEVLKVLGNNLLSVVVIMMGLNIILAFFIIRKLTKPVQDLMAVMKYYKEDDFSKRLPEVENKKLVYVINSAVNDMASTLEENQKIREGFELKRKEFLARISHDTKTPLASIRAHAEALRDGVVDEEKKKKYVENIISKVHALDNMINELNVYSDLEVGENQYSFRSININDYLEDVIEELKYDYDAKLSYIPSKSEHHVTLDVQRFHRVMMNLIGNSVRYSERENLEIEVNLSFDDDDSIISVKDNGIGVRIDNPNELMESFRRGDTSRDPNKSGSGLGLAIVKSIVDKHGGRIDIHTEYGKYFEIVIRLPIEGGLDE